MDSEEVTRSLQWLAYYVVKSRVAKETNLHPLYLTFLDGLQQPKLMEMVTQTTYSCLKALLGSEVLSGAVASSQHRQGRRAAVDSYAIFFSPKVICLNQLNIYFLPLTRLLVVDIT